MLRSNTCLQQSFLLLRTLAGVRDTSARVGVRTSTYQGLFLRTHAARLVVKAPQAAGEFQCPAMTPAATVLVRA